MNYGEIRPAIQMLANAATKLGYACKDIEMLADMAENSDTFQAQIIASAAEDAYTHALSAALSAQSILAQTVGEEKAKSIIQETNQKGSGIEFSVQFDADYDFFSCKCMTPPILKAQAAKGKFYELFCMELEEEIIKNIPADFQRISQAYVIFISHFDSQKPPNKQPYFDNDNLALKGLLDAIVPNICFDDATKFCDNLYLAQPDNSDFCEIHIVPKEHLLFWVFRHQSLCFSKEITNSFFKKTLHYIIKKLQKQR